MDHSSSLSTLPTLHEHSDRSGIRADVRSVPSAFVGELLVRGLRAGGETQASTFPDADTFPDAGTFPDADTFPDAPPFLLRRALQEAERLPPTPERSSLIRVAERALAPAADDRSVAEALLQWAGHLESSRRLAEAGRVVDLARERAPEDSSLLLHAARIARKSGEASRARRLYGALQEVEGSGRHLGRMAAVGAALVDADPCRCLATTIRSALRAGDREAAAVALEERARLRRQEGDGDGAVRDYAAAALRFRDPVDWGRVGHELTDLLLLLGQEGEASHVLVRVERWAHPRQADRARSRLYALALARGDEVGCRRWRPAHTPVLVSLTPLRPRRRSGPDTGRQAPATASASRLRRIFELLPAD